MNEIQNKSIELFKQHFKRDPEFVSYAPGRVNIIGEHTDYNDGFVLPCAIKYGTAIAASFNGTDTNQLVAADIGNGDQDSFSVVAPIEKHADKTWSNYLRGVTLQLQKRGCALKGMDLVITGNVPLGGGLSSSASLEIAYGNLFNQALDLNIDLQQIALMGQAAEAYIGCKCGIMDQTISACGRQDNLLLIDCRSLKLTQVPVPSDLEVMVINSNVKHQLVGGEYNERRAQCEAAAKVLGVKALRDATMPMLDAVKDKLDDVTYRRARHVITEDDRVMDAVAALKQGDFARVARDMYASHCSMRDDFEITIPEIDALVEIIRKAIGKDAGVRMTGGGFGGSVVALVKPEQTAAVTAAVEAEYEKVSGHKASIFITHAYNGAAFTRL